MKIVYISNNSWPGKEPGLTFSVFSTRGFRQAGADCLLILLGRTSRSVQEVYKELFGFEVEFPILPIRVPRIGGSKFLFYLATFLYLMGCDKDVLIARNLNFLPWAVMLRKLKGMRIFFEAHDFWTDPSLRQEGISAGQRRQVRLERKWLPCVDGIICQSMPQTQLYQAYYPGMPVFTALSGTKPSAIVRRKEFSYTMGYIGSFTESRYPIAIVMKALAAINHPEIRLVCVGAKDEKELERWRREAMDLGLNNRVEVYPWLMGSSLEQLKERMDVGIAVLSSDILSNRINTPLKILEYLSSVTPFIATKLDAISALITHGRQGFLVNNTPEAWEEAIRAIYRDFSIYQRMAKDCEVLGAELTWENRARKIIGALDTGILSKSRTCPD